MDNRLFKEYLYLHKEILSFLRSIVEKENMITTNIVIFSIYVISKQMQFNRDLTRKELMGCSFFPHSSYYRTVSRCKELGLIKEFKTNYRFMHQVPPHLKLSTEVHQKILTV